MLKSPDNQTQKTSFVSPLQCGDNASIERLMHGRDVRWERANSDLWVLELAVCSAIVDDEDTG